MPREMDDEPLLSHSGLQGFFKNLSFSDSVFNMVDRSELTVGHFMQKYMDGKLRSNKNLSLRSVAQKLNLSAGMLSQVINGHRKLSIKTALIVAEKMKLSEHERNFFLTLVTLESTQIKSVRERLFLSLENQIKIQGNTSKTTIDDLLENHRIQRVLTYVKDDEHSVRTLHLLKSDLKKPRSSFYDIFVSPSRSVAAVSYFVHHEKDIYQGIIDPLTATTDLHSFPLFLNQSMNVSWVDGLPQVSLVTNKVLGTSLVRVGEMLFSEKSMRIVGEELDLLDPEYSCSVEICYKRIE